MSTQVKRALRPRLENIEDRCLLSSAVVEIENQSTYNVTFEFRWTPSSAWTAYTEAPGQSEVISTAYSASLTPQVLYDTTTSRRSQTTVNLVQGYSDWTGTGTPPASAATVYGFENTAPGSNSITSRCRRRHRPMPSWRSRTRALTTSLSSSGGRPPRPGRLTPKRPASLRPSTPRTRALSPAGPLRHDNIPQLADDCQPAQGYSEWTGTGTPPASAGTPYAFVNTSTGVTSIRYLSTPTPTPRRRRRHRRHRLHRQLRSIADAAQRRPRHRRPNPRDQQQLVGLRGRNQFVESAGEFGVGRLWLVDRSDGNRIIEWHDLLIRLGGHRWLF